MLTQSETLMYLLAGLLAVEHAAASPCMLLAASSDADCESLCDGCRLDLHPRLAHQLR